MIYAATGHRPDKLGGYASSINVRLVRVATTFLTRSEDITYGIVGMAQGWDQAVAEALIEADIPFTAAVPFKGQERLWPTHAQRRYEGILARAKKIVIVCDGGYSVEKMQTRNVWMVDRCNAMLALWNGSAGGTRNCIRYAGHKERPIVNMWDEFKRGDRK